MKRTRLILAATATLATFSLWAGAFQFPLAPKPPDSQAATVLPSAQGIINKFIDAVGGRSAILRHNSSRAKGTYEVAGKGKANGTIELLSAAPNKLLVRITFRGGAEIRRGFDGQVGWELIPGAAPRLLKGKELDQMREGSDFYWELHEDKGLHLMETVQLTEFEGKSCYELQLFTQSGDTYREFYDAENFLLAGRVSTQPTPSGPIEMTTVVADYKKFAELWVATKIITRYVVAGQPYEERISITAIEHDTVNPSAFALPAKIRALVDLQVPR